MHISGLWTTVFKADLVCRSFSTYGGTIRPLWGTVSGSPERCRRAHIRRGSPRAGTVPEKGGRRYVTELKVFPREWLSEVAEAEGEQPDICLLVCWVWGGGGGVLFIFWTR